MADLLQLAQERRDSLARELKELDSFISMARYLANAMPEDTNACEAKISVETIPLDAMPVRAEEAADNLLLQETIRRNANKAPEMDAAVFWKSFFRTPDAPTDHGTAPRAATA
ncbi:MAG: hypothetical protein AAF415_01840 [Pseudomonadota bacterium]